MPSVTRFVLAYTAAYNRTRNRAALAVGAAWDRYAGPDDDALDVFADRAVAVVLAAQAHTAAAVDGYIATLAAAPTVGVVADYPRPADPMDVYRRPGITVRKGLSDGVLFADAMATGRARAVATAATDVALAQRAATVEVAQRQSGVVGYRRVLTGQSCALCAAASTQRYGQSELAPIHGGCDCGVAPIIGTFDPAKQVNHKIIADLRAAAKESGPSDYWRNRHVTVEEDGTVILRQPSVHEHGELGPVLTDPDHAFTGPGDLAA